jgi:hypothetical protein
MNYEAFLTRIIEDGIAAAKRDYTGAHQQVHLLGSLAGFEACRNKQPHELCAILDEAQEAAEGARRQHDVPMYWFKRCYQLEVRWVCNVVSAMLMNEGLPIIVPVSARGVLKAAEIIGIKR